MALDKIRQANKKARHQAKRKVAQARGIQQRRNERVRQKRARKMMIEGRREFMAKRRAEKSYVDQLEAELTDG